MNPKPDRDQPLDRAFAILDYIASQIKSVTVADIAVNLGLPLPSTHRIIVNLEARELIHRAPGSKRYVVGNKLVILAGKTIRSAFRTARRHAVLQNVAAEIGEQCEIGIIRNNTVIYVDSIPAPTPQGLQFDPGSSAPLHCTSTGKIYMSRLPRKAQEKLISSLALTAFTDSTITSPKTLLNVLNSVRKDGWAKTNEEYVKGVVGCAVPIVAPDNTLIACLGVSVPAARVPFANLELFREPLIRAASLLSTTILEADTANADITA